MINGRDNFVDKHRECSYMHAELAYSGVVINLEIST